MIVGERYCIEYVFDCCPIERGRTHDSLYVDVESAALVLKEWRNGVGR